MHSLKLIKTSLIVLISAVFCWGQEFAPIGALWYVELAQPFVPDWTGTLTNESLRDTTIKNLPCRVIFKSHATTFNEIQGEYVLCQSGDSILHYIPALDSMNVVMDFGAGIGESWESFDQANSYIAFGFELNYKYQVDSIGFIVTPNSDTLKVQYLTEYKKLWTEPDSMYRFPDKRELIQSVGFRSALLPTNGGDGITDDIFETEIRCYEDDNLGVIKFGHDSNCLISTTGEPQPGIVTVYPNPSPGWMLFENLQNIDIDMIQIVDTQGRLISSMSFSERIDISSLENGIYFINVFAKKGYQSTRILLLK